MGGSDAEGGGCGTGGGGRRRRSGEWWLSCAGGPPQGRRAAEEAAQAATGSARGGGWLGGGGRGSRRAFRGCSPGCVRKAAPAVFPPQPPPRIIFNYAHPACSLNDDDSGLFQAEISSPLLGPVVRSFISPGCFALGPVVRSPGAWQNETHGSPAAPALACRRPPRLRSAAAATTRSRSRRGCGARWKAASSALLAVARCGEHETARCMQVEGLQVAIFIVRRSSGNGSIAWRRWQSRLVAASTVRAGSAADVTAARRRGGVVSMTDLKGMRFQAVSCPSQSQIDNVSTAGRRFASEALMPSSRVHRGRSQDASGERNAEGHACCESCAPGGQGAAS